MENHVNFLFLNLKKGHKLPVLFDFNSLYEYATFYDFSITEMEWFEYIEWLILNISEKFKILKNISILSEEKLAELTKTATENVPTASQSLFTTEDNKSFEIYLKMVAGLNFSNIQDTGALLIKIEPVYQNK